MISKKRSISRSKTTKYTNTHINTHTKQHSKLLLGCHASITPSVLEGIQYAQGIGANAVQIFLGSNKSASMEMKTKFTNSEITEIRKYITQNGIRLIIHSIYLLNFCNGAPTSGEVRYMQKNLLHDMQVGAKLGAQCVVLHLGFTPLHI
jgi:endonuclease IV